MSEYKSKLFCKDKVYYKGKLICREKVYYNIHHFNWIQKIIARVFYGIKIEDVEVKDE